MILGLLALMFLLRHLIFKNYFDFGTNDILEIESDLIKEEFKFSSWDTMSCVGIREFLESKREQEPNFLPKVSRYLTSKFLKNLIDCKIIEFEKDENIFNEFSDWKRFKENYPESFEEIFVKKVSIRNLTTWSMRTVPIEDLIMKLENLDGCGLDDEILVNKLPIKNILNHLIITTKSSEETNLNETSVNTFDKFDTESTQSIDSKEDTESTESKSCILLDSPHTFAYTETPFRSSSHFWKLFNESCFQYLQVEDRILLMKYFSLLPLNFDEEEDLLLWIVRTENFLMIQLLGGTEFYMLDSFNDNLNEIEFFSYDEKLIDYFLAGRRNAAGLIPEIPLSRKLKVVLIKLISSDFAGGDCAEIEFLVKKLHKPKPIDTSLNFLSDSTENIDQCFRSSLKWKLLNFFTIENLLSDEKYSFFELIQKYKVKSPFYKLELLRISEVKDLMGELELIYEEISKESTSSFHSKTTDITKEPTSETITGISYSSLHYNPRNLNNSSYSDVLDISYYSLLEWIKISFESNMPALLLFFASKYEKFLKNEDIEQILKFQRIDYNLFYLYSGDLQFFKLNFLIPEQLKSMKNVLVVDLIEDYSKEMKDESQLLQTKNKQPLLEAERKLLSEAFNFYRKSTDHSRYLITKFRGVSSQDVGGLSRHFLETCLVALTRSEFCLFHENNGVFVPRTLLDTNVLGFLGFLHGQCLKLKMKIPWMISFDYDKLPISICDIIKGLEYDTAILARNSSDGDCNSCVLVPSLHHLLNWLNCEFKLFHDRFDVSNLELSKPTCDQYYKILGELEMKYWQAGYQEYVINLMKGVRKEIVEFVGKERILKDIWDLLSPVSSAQVNLETFLTCFQGTDDPAILESIRRALQKDPVNLIPSTIKFVTGSKELPPGGLRFFRINLKVIPVEWPERRYPQASTCFRTIFWFIAAGETVENMSEKFFNAIVVCKSFDLE